MMGASAPECLGPIASAVGPSCGLQRVPNNLTGQSGVPHARVAKGMMSTSACHAKYNLGRYDSCQAAKLERGSARNGGLRRQLPLNYPYRQGRTGAFEVYADISRRPIQSPQGLQNGFLGQALLHRHCTSGRHLPRRLSAKASLDIFTDSCHSAIDNIVGAIQVGAHLPAVALAAGVLGGVLSAEGFEGWEVAIATATGLTAGALASWALSKSRNEPPEVSLKGKLIPLTENEFNRLVLARSPLLKDLDSGRCLRKSVKDEGTSFKYRRHCIRLTDGGHLAFDWPAHLAMLGDDCRDSVVMIIPGTAAGSSDEGVKMLVQRAEQLGHFPVVLNQRGFAGSPVTTPKLFDAGCTEDLAQAVAFIREQKPGATISAVATGMGANMLVKYLGERAPCLDAAVAVGCPFDLAASTDNLMRPSNHDRSALLATERAELLRQHLPLFEGNSFSVEPALTAASVAEFDELFTWRANGYFSKEGYYGAASCGGYVEDVNTPLLFIQSEEDALAPAAAIPRATIHKNPCTSLLLTRGSSDISMTSLDDPIADVALEWLAAVELALLKGKDPRGFKAIENGALADGEETELQAAFETESDFTSDGAGSENGRSAREEEARVGELEQDATKQHTTAQESTAESVPKTTGQGNEPKAAAGNEEPTDAVSKRDSAQRKSGKAQDAPQDSEGTEEPASPSETGVKGLKMSDMQTSKEDGKGLEGSTTEVNEGSPSEEEKALQLSKAEGERAGAKAAAENLDGSGGNGKVSSDRPSKAVASAKENEHGKSDTGLQSESGGNAEKEEVEKAEEKGSRRVETGAKTVQESTKNSAASGKAEGRQIEEGQRGGERQQGGETGSRSATKTAVQPAPGTTDTKKGKNETLKEEEKGVVAQKKEGKNAVEDSKNGKHEKTKEEKKGGNVQTKGDKEGVVTAKDKDKSETKAEKESASENGATAKDGKKGEEKTDSKEGEPPKEGEEAPPPPADAKGIATATAESFLNVADVALPGTLSEEKKQQVVAAVNKGESLTTALDLAVPPDVRLKVTGAVQTYMQTTQGKAGELTKQIDMDRVSGLFASGGGGLVEKIAGSLKGGLGGPPPKAPDPPKPAAKPPPKADAGKASPPQSAPPPKTEPQKGGEPAPPKTEPPKAEAPPDKPKSEAPPPQENKPPPVEPTKADAAPKSDVKDKPPPPQNNEAPKSDGTPAPNATEASAEKAATPPQQSNDAPAAGRGGAERAESTPPPKNETPKKDDTPPPQNASAEKPNGPAQSGETKQAGDNQNQSGGAPQPSGEAAPPPPPAEAPKDDAPPPPTAEEPGPPTHVESASHAAAVVQPAVDSVQAAAAPPNAAPPPAAPLPPPPQLSNVGSALTTLDQGFDDGTQRAVHNVFGVLEGVIDTLEAAEAAKEPEKAADKAAAKAAEGNGNGNGKAGTETETSSGNDLREKEIAKEVDENGRAEVTGTTEQGTKQTLVVEQHRTESANGQTSVENEVQAEASRDTGGATDSHVDVSVSRTKVQNGQSKESGKEKVKMSVDDGNGSVVTTERVCEQEAAGNNGRAVITEHREGNTTNGAVKTGSLNGAAKETHQNGASNNGAANGKAKVDNEIEANRQRLQQQYEREPNPPVKDNSEPSSGGGVLQAVKSSPPVAVVSQAVGTVGSTAAAVANGLPDNRKLELADVILTSLKLEIGRRVGTSGFNALTQVNWEEEAGKVAQAVSDCLAGGGALEGLAEPPGPRGASGTEPKGSQARAKRGVDIGAIMEAIGSAVGTGGMFGGLLPMGVLVGVVVAAVGTIYHVMQDDKEKKAKEEAEAIEAAENHAESVPIETEDDIALGLGTKWDEEPEGESGVAEIEPDHVEHVTPHKGLSSEQTATIIGAGGVVAAAAATVAASATGVTAADLPQAISPPPGQQNAPQGAGGLSNTVGHLATQAVAVVKSQIPRDASGDVDQERLVLLLADAGGRGGMFRVAGKLALFWGGIRGATRVTERLLGFLKMEQRNLPKRILGFGAMALILWTPVLFPLLPTILGHRATGGQGGIAEAAAAAGLYLAVLMLIHIWGRVVRGFKRPFTAYGLRMFNRRSAGQMITGQAAGVFLVAAYYALQLRLGHVTWLGGATEKPAANVAAGIVRSFGKVHLVIHAFAVGVAVSLVEELIFRSWIHEEAAADLGPHGAALLSAALFSLAHWTRTAAPGLFLLGIALIGARARARGNLALPMGLHSGLIAANYVAQVGQLTVVNTRSPVWLTGGGNPLVSALGIGMTAVMAIGLYPWRTGFMMRRDPQEEAPQNEMSEEEATRQIQEHGEQEESDLKARIDDLGGQEQGQLEGGETGTNEQGAAVRAEGS